MQKILLLKPNSQTLRRSADRKAGHALRPFLNSLNKCTPHSRYFSDELGVQIFW